MIDLDRIFTHLWCVIVCDGALTPYACIGFDIIALRSIILFIRRFFLHRR